MNNNQASQKLGYKGKENNDGISFKNLSFLKNCESNTCLIEFGKYRKLLKKKKAKIIAWFGKGKQSQGKMFLGKLLEMIWKDLPL